MGTGESFYAAQASILEQVANGTALPTVLDAIVRLVEIQAPGMLCTILLYDEDRGTLHHGAGPSLPPAYLRAIDGEAIGDDRGSCGAAAARRERVIVEDIATHPNWVEFRRLALPHGLLASWSTPILSSEQALLGTFAMYYRETRGPRPDEIGWVDAATHLAAVAIVRDRQERARQRSEARARHLARLYAVSSAVNEALVRARDPQAILDTACRIAVEHGLAKLAWVGRYHDPDDRIVPVSRFGDDDGYVDALVLGIRDRRLVAGPAARALQSGAPSISNDIADDPGFHFKADALRRGLRACAVFPLRFGDGAAGMLAIYGDTAGFFGAEELRVLGTVASHISYCLESLANESERRRAEDALRENERRLRLLNALGETIRELGDPERVLPAALRLLGRHLKVSRCVYADVEADGDRITVPHDYTDDVPSIIGAHRLSSVGAMLADQLRRGAGPVVVRDVEAEVSDADGRAWLLGLGIRSFVNCTLVRDGVSRAMMSVHHAAPRDWTATEVDILQTFVERCWATIEQRAAAAKLREKDDQLRHAQKLEAVGHLAGAVAHDFNNVLSVVLTYSQLIAGSLDDADPLRPDLDEIQRAGERASELTRQLLAFSRKQMMRPRVVDLGQIATGLEKMLRRLLSDEIQFAVVGEPGLGKVMADPGQIEQVLMNLVVNARDAMPAGGSLTIETRNAVIAPDDPITQVEAVPGSYVALAVADTGHGIDAATRSHIFEPFFTTKELGKGTGLGLSTVYGIVRQSGGHITVATEVGAGTTFTVYLPRIDLPVAPDVAEVPVPASLRGTETILVVEDDVQVRGVMKSILKRSGYDVIVADTSGDAILICEQHAAPIHLLVTDVVMPRLSGRELAGRLVALRPSLRVIYVSGYAEDAIIRHGMHEPGIEFLAKPIRPDALLRKVREVLG